MTNTIKSPGSLTLGADLDNLSVGVYQITGVKINVLGTAVTIWGTIIVCRRAFDYQQVILSNGTKAIYYRSKNESEAWTEWKQLITNTDLTARFNPIKINGELNDTFKSILKDKCNNSVNFIAFTNNPSDNPFSFNAGYVIAFHSGMISSNNILILIGSSNDASSPIEVKRFDLRS